MSDFTIVDARNLEWRNAEHTVIKGEVLFEGYVLTLGFLPFSVDDAYMPYRHERDFWDGAIAGTWGPIAEYVDPNAEQPE